MVMGTMSVTTRMVDIRTILVITVVQLTIRGCMLVVFHNDEFVAAKNEGVWHPILQPMIDFAKSINCWESPVNTFHGRDAVYEAFGNRKNCIYVIGDSEIEIDPRAALDVIKDITKVCGDNVNISDVIHNKIIFKSKSQDKDSCMYLEDALEYLDTYGKSANSRVAIFPSRTPDDMANLSFQNRHSDSNDWREWMIGGLVFFKWENKKYEGWSVHT